MTNDELWKRLGKMTAEELVTQTKLHGSTMQLLGTTKPEGWPFIVVVGVAKPENEGIMNLVREFHDKMVALVAWSVRREKGNEPEVS